MKNIAKLLLMWLFVPAAICQTSIPAGSTVYIQPADGFESYISAALLKKDVPVAIVTDRSKAKYVITSVVNQRGVDSPSVVINNTNGNNNNANSAPTLRGVFRSNSSDTTSVSVTVIDSSTTQVVFAHSVEKMSRHQLQSAAEDCAKRLREFILKQKK